MIEPAENNSQMSRVSSNESLGAAELLSSALERTGSLMRNEVDLARAEVQENVQDAGNGIGILVASLIFALTALNVLVASLVAGLAELGMDEGLAALIVGGLFAVAAYALMQKGLNALKLSSLAPTRAASNLKSDAQAAKEGLK